MPSATVDVVTGFTAQGVRRWRRAASAHTGLVVVSGALKGVARGAAIRIDGALTNTSAVLGLRANQIGARGALCVGRGGARGCDVLRPGGAHAARSASTNAVCGAARKIPVRSTVFASAADYRARGVGVTAQVVTAFVTVTSSAVIGVTIAAVVARPSTAFQRPTK